METKDGPSTFQQWSLTTLGRAFLSVENTRLRETIAYQFGFHLAFSGVSSSVAILQESPILHRIVLTPSTPMGEANCIHAKLTELPFLTEGLDVLILQHCLEFTKEPHQLLQEAARVLLGEGRLVLFLFNPMSLWGLVRLFGRKKTAFPWSGHFYSWFRVLDWLKVLGFEEIEVTPYFNRPPVNNEAWLSQLEFLETWKCLKWLGIGGGYRIVAKKRQVCMTSTRVFSPVKRRLVITGLAHSGP